MPDNAEIQGHRLPSTELSIPTDIYHDRNITFNCYPGFSIGFRPGEDPWEVAKESDIINNRELTKAALQQADEVMIVLQEEPVGTNEISPPLGEFVMGTAFINPVHEALRIVGNDHAKVRVCVQENQQALIPNGSYGDNVEIVTGNFLDNTTSLGEYMQEDRKVLLLDFRGGLSGFRPEPALGGINYIPFPHKAIPLTVDGLFYRSIETFTNKRFGPRRYAAAIEALFNLPVGSIDITTAQPKLHLPDDEAKRYQLISQELGIVSDDKTINMALITQVNDKLSEKAYTLANWAKALRINAEELAQKHPKQKINLNLIIDEYSRLKGFSKEEIYTAFAHVFDGLDLQGKVNAVSLGLQDLAIFLHHQDIFVSTDTGPRHIAEAVGVPGVVIYHPVFQADIWKTNAFLETSVEIDHLEDFPPNKFITISGDPIHKEIINDPEIGIPPEKMSRALTDKIEDVCRQRHRFAT